MRSPTSVHRFLPLLLLLAAPPAWAQATRTWVSGVGDDANPCSRTAPCKTFAGAISKTAAGGEIDALDPGGFGALTITKAITLDGRGTFASVLVVGTNGIVVAAGANDTVVIRGLDLHGMGQGLSGISFQSGAALHVEDCTIEGFTKAAIDVEPATAPAAPQQLFVKHTIVGVNAAQGLVVGQNAVAVVERSQFFGNAIGAEASGSARLTLHECVFAASAMFGVHSSGMAEVNVDQGVIANNGVGVQGDALVRLSDVMVANNTTGITGMVASFGNNRLAAGNQKDGMPSSTLPQQ